MHNSLLKEDLIQPKKLEMGISYDPTGMGKLHPRIRRRTACYLKGRCTHVVCNGKNVTGKNFQRESGVQLAGFAMSSQINGGELTVRFAKSRCLLTSRQE